MAPMKCRVQCKIKERLVRLGHSQSWMAQQLGMTATHLNKLVLGKLVPRIDTAYICASVLGCLIEDLWVIDETDL
jgi:DNA-binding XRE family transcriptional regulator